MIELSVEPRQGASAGPARSPSAELPQPTVSDQEPVELNSPQSQVSRVQDGPGRPAWLHKDPQPVETISSNLSDFPGPLAYSPAFDPFPAAILVTRNWEALTCSWTSPGQGRPWKLELAVPSETQRPKSPGSSGQPHTI